MKTGDAISFGRVSVESVERRTYGGVSGKTITGGNRSDRVLKLRPKIPVLSDEGRYPGACRSGEYEILRIHDGQTIHDLDANCVDFTVCDPFFWRRENGGGPFPLGHFAHLQAASPARRGRAPWPFEVDDEIKLGRLHDG